MGAKRSQNADTKDLTSTLMNFQLRQMTIPNTQISPASGISAGASSTTSNGSDGRIQPQGPWMNSIGSVTSPIQPPSPSFPSMNSMSMGSSTAVQFPGGFPRMGTASMAGNGHAFTSSSSVPFAGNANFSQIRSVPPLVPASLQQKQPVENVKALSQRDIDDFLK